MNRAFFVVVIVLSAILFLIFSRTPSPPNPPPPKPSCPDAGLCFDCNHFSKYDPSAFSTNEHNSILPLKSSFDACLKDSGCKGLLTLGGNAMLLHKTPMNYGHPNPSIYYEKKRA